MKDFVSSPRLGVISVVAAASILCVASTFLLPDGLRWMSLGWLAVAASVGWWLSVRVSNRSVSQILYDLDAQPVPVPSPKPGIRPTPTSL